jgi:hypothetical protein
MSANPAKIGKGRYYQGYYKPTNPDKYIGDPAKIIYRSSWERKVCHKFDHNKFVVAWGCEPFPIWYQSPKDGMPHRYFPDFMTVSVNKDRKKIVTIYEVKPLKETHAPKKQGKKKSRYLKEHITYKVNTAKWEAAKSLCDQKGWNFVILTEKEILAK